MGGRGYQPCALGVMWRLAAFPVPKLWWLGLCEKQNLLPGPLSSGQSMPQHSFVLSLNEGPGSRSEPLRAAPIPPVLGLNAPPTPEPLATCPDAFQRLAKSPGRGEGNCETHMEASWALESRTFEKRADRLCSPGPPFPPYLLSSPALRAQMRRKGPEVLAPAR